MATLTTTPVSNSAPAAPAIRRLWSLYMELGKSRLSGMVAMTAAAGYALAVPGTGEAFNFIALGWTAMGTMLCACAANALNQVIEIDRDALMPRTRNRPLPSGRISVMHATAMAIIWAGTGLTILAAQINLLTAALALLNIFLYLAIYTPLKTRSTLNTLVGAVVGAIPPLMGWTAARGDLSTAAYALAGVLLVWQVPHFLALAWMFRKDYALGGYRMLPLVDPTGRITSHVVLIWCLALLPVALCATLVGVSGWTYGVGSIALGLWLLALGLKLYQQRTDAAARKLFLASVIYLPLLMGLMVYDRPSLPDLYPPTQAQAAPSAPAKPGDEALRIPAGSPDNSPTTPISAASGL